ncbi:MAG: histidine phosphatase family protein [Leptospirales bacterium]
MAARKIILIRHSETTQHGVYLGHEDPPLSDKGRTLLNSFSIDITKWKKPQIFVSPLVRAVQTAEILFPERPTTVDARLKEINFGKFGGKSFTEIKSEFPEKVDRWANEFMSFEFPGGESVVEFKNRVESFLEDTLHNTNGSFVLVAHGGVIRFLLCKLLDIPYEKHLTFFLKRPSINMIDLSEEYGTLSGLNIENFSIRD